MHGSEYEKKYQSYFLRDRKKARDRKKVVTPVQLLPQQAENVQASQAEALKQAFLLQKGEERRKNVENFLQQREKVMKNVRALPHQSGQLENLVRKQTLKVVRLEKEKEHKKIIENLLQETENAARNQKHFSQQHRLYMQNNLRDRHIQAYNRKMLNNFTFYKHQTNLNLNTSHLRNHSPY
jgi:glutamate/tyrosine decarboxylase-like PLP-dependent enzyme